MSSNAKRRRERKQIITLAVAFFAVIALVAVFFIVKNAVDGDGEGTDTNMFDVYDQLGAPGTYTLIDEDFKLMTSLEYKYNGEDIKLHIEDGRWRLDGDDKFPVDQEKLVMMSQAISDYGGFRQVTYNEKNREQYGIDEPLYEITATYFDSESAETKHTVHAIVGKQNSITGYYYFYLPEKYGGYIYMVNDALFEYFSYGAADLFDNADTPAPVRDDVIALDIVTGAGEYHYDSETDKTDDVDADAYDPVGAALEALPRASTLEYGNVAAYGVDESAISEYGLDEPAATVHMKYYEYTTVQTADGGSSARMPKETEYTVSFGERFTEDGVDYVYVYAKGSGIVYKVLAIYLDGIVDVLNNANAQ